MSRGSGDPERSGTKRTVTELITLYELEPDLSEVITEGRTDAAILKWFFGRLDSETAVYCVTDRLDISEEQVRARNLNVGNRGYVVTAALEIQDESPTAARNVTCVYDIDDDAISGDSPPSVECLVSTDYASMEMYCFSEKPVGKLLMLTLRVQDEVTAGSVLAAIGNPLVEIFYARSILSRRTPAIGIADAFEKKCKLSGQSIRIDVRGLINDAIGAKGGSKALGIDAGSIIEQIQLAMTNRPSDIRLAIRGHDFTRACCFYLKTRYPSLFKDDRQPYKTPEVFENVLITCLEVDDLASQPLFQSLMKRHGVSEPSARSPRGT